MLLRFTVLVYFSVLSFYSFEGNAQIENDVLYYKSGFNSVTINARTVGVKGTPFLFDDAVFGDILLPNGTTHLKIPFNFEMVKEELVIKMSDDDNPPFPVKKWISVETKDENPRKFILENIEAKKRIVEYIGEWEGFKIVALHSKKLYKPTNLPDSYSSPQFDTYQHYIKFFKIKGLQFEELKVNQFVKDLGGKEIKEFIKSNKLKVDDPVDLKMLLQSLN
ncbi:hypothetical protein Belba_2695 [Belliella baltica DSM 15883]|uniref:DUF4369 domain-containing protein n=1 Tax=Belliella baltica (strain DSM 15883 / CIP 108006 / LMG 21964 / BA134) TaxID=866536 RepID=I3Z7M1_BELBD|nr:hypothetical protein [Belliella baltica]AFL85239.1 hypothetical protein Belba_2695 [Belliella baltica DSM 15883]